MSKNNTVRNFSIVFLFSISVGMFNSCGSSSKLTDDNGAGQALDSLVSQRRFEVRSDWAMPMATASMNSISNSGLLPPGSSAGQISLIGNANYLKMMGDSVAIYLPYFGERQMGGGYDNDGPGIEFEGIPEDMKVSKNDAKQRYDIRFSMKDDSENFNVNLSLYQNLSSMINVNSSQRFPIRYSGTVDKIPIEN
ncbi:DUF4251 domain-containing protein [Pricia sp.]|uniref:DUF4251 domain-containing protein n=1 Tax=Pricia sp. TaxID=2268138 RepID=UPI003593CAC3